MDLRPYHCHHEDATHHLLTLSVNTTAVTTTVAAYYSIFGLILRENLITFCIFLLLPVITLFLGRVHHVTASHHCCNNVREWRLSFRVLTFLWSVSQMSRSKGAAMCIAHFPIYFTDALISFIIILWTGWWSTLLFIGDSFYNRAIALISANAWPDLISCLSWTVGHVQWTMYTVHSLLAALFV